ncbi:MAG: ATP-binding protein [Planctomycetota bacterium]
MTRLPLLAMLLVVAASTVHAQSEALSYRRFSTSDGLPQNSVNAITQSPDGHLWFATFGGLARFDGVVFQSFTRSGPEGLPTNRITALAVDAEGTLLVGTQDAGLLAYRDGRFREIRGPDGRTFGQVFALARDAAGRVWVLERELLAWDGKDWLPHREDVGDVEELDALLALALRPDGEIQIVLERGSRRFDGMTFVATPEFDGEGRPRAETWLVDSARQILVASQRFDFAARLAAIGGHRIGHVKQDTVHDSRGRCWMPTDTGLVVVERDRILRVSEHVAAWDDRFTIRCGFVDGEGNVWIGLNSNGVACFTAQSYLFWPEAVTNSDDPRRVAIDAEETTWIRSGNTRLARIENGRRVFVRDFDELNDVAVDATATLVVGTSAGLLRRREAGFETLHPAPSRGILTLPDGTLITSGSEGAFEIGRDGSARDLAGVDGGRGDGRIPFARTPDGATWFLDDDEILRRDAEGARRVWTADEGLPTPVRWAHVDGGGTLWVSSYGLGLARLGADGRFRHYTTRDGLADDSLGRIFEDRRETLWINSNRGVFSVAREDFDRLDRGETARLRCLLVGAPEGNGRGGFRDARGRLWFTTIRGVIAVDPANVHLNLVPPPVVIRALRAGGASLALGSEIDVPRGERNLEIDFAGISFTNPAHVTYHYRLEGRDEGWTDAGLRRSAAYTDLAPGRYVFEVYAVNEAGVRSLHPAEVSFVVPPHFYETTAFKVLMGALALLVTLGLHQWKVRGLRDVNQRLVAEMAERARAEEQRAHLQNQLAESKRLEAIGRLTGGISHDFNNILTALIGNAEILRRRNEESDAPERARHIDRILDSSRRASNLVRQLLGFARRQVQQAEDVDLNRIVSRLLPMLGDLLPAPVRIRPVLAREPVCVHADPSQLEQVLMNLVLNARDAMPEGGVIGIETSGAPGDLARLAVTDTGPGIADEIRPHIFEPFFSTKPGAKGTGLGLASVHGIVHQCSGRIEVDSAVGRGSTFTVFLPRVAGAAPVPVEEPADEATLAGQETILLCEDDDAIRGILKRSFETYGYRVLAASGPGEARTMAVQAGEELDLLVTDLVMPGGNGRDLARSIQRERPETRVIYMSGYTSDIINDADLARPDTRFLQKPFAPAELLRKVRNLLDS